MAEPTVTLAAVAVHTAETRGYAAACALAERIEHADEERLHGRAKVHPVRSNRASMLDDACDTGGVFILKNKLTGRLKAVPFALDYEYADGLLRKAQRVDAALATKQPPPFLDDEDECRRCSFFGRACNPPVDGGEGATVVTAEHLIEAAKVWRETRAAAKAHEDAERELKDALRGRPVALVNDLIVTTKPRIVQYKAQPARTVEQQVVSIRPLAGGGT